MRIISYNVNGIRAAVSKGFLEWLKEESPDVICIQETKAQPEQIDSSAFEALGYHCYWYSAEKKGYSGVGILSKRKPIHVEYGMGIEKYDREGRFLRVDFDSISIASIYHPSGSSGDERQAFKMQWLSDFRNYVKQLQKEHPNLILSGDYNICRLWIDIHNPKQNINTSGFLPEEREWFQTFIEDGFVDSFREFNESPHHYSWWSYRAQARTKNKGWRIDYHILTEKLKPLLKDAFILPEVHHSDHCPVGINLTI